MAVTSDQPVRLIGFNTQGLKSNVVYISELIDNHDIIFLCEHWLSNSEETIVKDISSQTHNYLLSTAEKHPVGRPFGGNCFVIRKNIFTNISVIHEEKSIFAIKVTISEKINYIIIGLYLTCYHDYTSIEKYIDELNIITSIIKSNLGESEVIIIGDFQTFPQELYDDLPRSNNTRNRLSPHLKSFLKSNSLALIDVENGSGPTTTYQHKSLPNSSYIDHIALLKESNINYSSCIVHETNINNMSDHQPVAVTIQITPCLETIINDVMPKNSIPSYAWKDEHFRSKYN